MLNKSYIIFIFLCITISQEALAQEVCGEVTYVYATHFSRDFERDFILYFNNSESNFQEVLANKKSSIKEKDTGNGILRTVDSYNSSGIPDCYYYNLTNLYFRENHLDEELLVKEEPFLWNWTITNETKKIGNFICTKASTTFRGRNYVAWFTQEVSLPYGPWKFYGLPGLILEVLEKDGVFHLYAKKVTFSNKEVCDYDMNAVPELFSKTMTIDEYNIRKIELLKESFKQLSSRLPKGSAPLILDENCTDCREEIERF